MNAEVYGLIVVLAFAVLLIFRGEVILLRIKCSLEKVTGPFSL